MGEWHGSLERGAIEGVLGVTVAVSMVALLAVTVALGGRL